MPIGPFVAVPDTYVVIASCPVPCRPGSLSVAVTYQSTGSGWPCGQTFTCTVVDAPGAHRAHPHVERGPRGVGVPGEHPVGDQRLGGADQAGDADVHDARRREPQLRPVLTRGRLARRDVDVRAAAVGDLVDRDAEPSRPCPTAGCPRVSWRASGCSARSSARRSPSTDDPETALQAPPRSAVPQPLAEVRSNSSAASTLASATVTGCVTDPDAPRLSTTVSVTSYVPAGVVEVVRRGLASTTRRRRSPTRTTAMVAPSAAVDVVPSKSTDRPSIWVPNAAVGFACGGVDGDVLRRRRGQAQAVGHRQRDRVGAAVRVRMRRRDAAAGRRVVAPVPAVRRDRASGRRRGRRAVHRDVQLVGGEGEGGGRRGDARALQVVLRHLLRRQHAVVHRDLVDLAGEVVARRPVRPAREVVPADPPESDVVLRGVVRRGRRPAGRRRRASCRPSPARPPRGASCRRGRRSRS